MKPILYSLAICTFFTFACAKVIENDASEITLPYPSISEQRMSLLNKQWVTPFRELDSSQIIHDLEYLASDICEGRKPGTVGHDLAKNYVLARMRAIGVDSFSSSLEQTFTGFNINASTIGRNLIGWLRGTSFPDKYIVITAHYDHLGKSENGEIYNGADDNASGVGCLLAIAKFFKQNPHSYSLVFAALDREETGLGGHTTLYIYWDCKWEKKISGLI